jgi:hypothetical protein
MKLLLIAVLGLAGCGKVEPPGPVFPTKQQAVEHAIKFSKTIGRIETQEQAKAAIFDCFAYGTEDWKLSRDLVNFCGDVVVKRFAATIKTRTP